MVWGLWFVVWGLGIGVQGWRFVVWGLGFRALSSRLKVEGVGDDKANNLAITVDESLDM